jgi:hypothetical protein
MSCFQEANWVGSSAASNLYKSLVHSRHSGKAALSLCAIVLPKLNGLEEQQLQLHDISIKHIFFNSSH